MDKTNIKNDESSIINAPQPITPECLRIIGIAMLPTAEAPVRNLDALIQLRHYLKYQEQGQKNLKDQNSVETWNTQIYFSGEKGKFVQSLWEAKTYPLVDSEYREEVSNPANRIKGIGRITYIITAKETLTYYKRNQNFQLSIILRARTVIRSSASLLMTII